MNLSSIYFFSKNTDAHESQRGYNFQTLKTLQSWVLNYVNNVEEDIYCEYEEDIFHKRNGDKNLKFRQIKLYSSSFSFSSPEIKKTIVNFFMLQIKSDYNDFNKEFIFETNSSISRKYRNNDANVLKEWVKNQDNLNEKHLKKYSNKSKEIVIEYLNSQRKLKDKSVLINKAINTLSKIDDGFWKNFVNSIKWKFSNTSPEDEFINVKTETEELITQLPFYDDENNLNHFFGILLDRVFTTTTKNNPDERILTSNQLEKLILTEKGNDDKWYINKHSYYKEIESIREFRIGEFFEILDLVNYCRRKEYLKQHKDKWNSLLDFYIKKDNVLNHYKRKAIYERVFLNNEFHEVDFDNLSQRVRPKGSLKGFEEELRFYFNDFSVFKSSNELHNSQNLLNVIIPAKIDENVEIELAELVKWIKSLYRQLRTKLSMEENLNEKCRLLEQNASFIMTYSKFKKKNEIKFLEYYESIIELIDEAPLYNVLLLGERIDKCIKMHINIDPKDELGIIKGLECFSEKLFPFIEKRLGKEKLAKSQVQRGVQYLNSKEPEFSLKALEYFHKAKENYSHEDTIDGYILSLLNIAQLYNSFNMHFAAKYYALAAFRLSSNNENIKLTQTSLGILFYCDFKQGSWFNALDTYNLYSNLKIQTNNETEDYLDEEGSISIRFVFMLLSLSKISNQFNQLVEFVILKLGNIGEEIIKPAIEQLNEEMNSLEKIKCGLEKEIDDTLLNDVGEERSISFYALGSLWKFTFKNDYDTQSLAEEFIANTQIILSEIALFSSDFHLLKSDIEIVLITSIVHKSPEEIPSNYKVKWKIFIVLMDEPDSDKMNNHNIKNMVSFQFVLNSISLLTPKDYSYQSKKFLKESSLGHKQFAVNLFQRIHRDIYSEKNIIDSRRESFQKESFELDNVKKNLVLKWNDSLSTKYDKTFSIESINNRFNNLQKSTYLTFDNLKKDKLFRKIILDLRESGLKDWQIASNMFNFIISHKIKRFENVQYKDDKQFQTEYQSLMIKYRNLDESACFIKFPAEAFLSEEFAMQSKISYTSILNTFGLECKLSTPHFNAIKEFLDVRFNLINDDCIENSPFKNIKRQPN